MSYLPPIPPELQEVEYVKIYVHLQLKSAFKLPELGLLQLRRELFQAFKTLEGWGQDDDVAELRELLQPPLSDDPTIRRQAQKPAPAFILFPDPQLHGPLDAGHRLVLPVLFLGRGVRSVEAFISLLQQLAQQGLYHGQGAFELEAVESEDASGVRAMQWTRGIRQPLSLPIGELLWLLERQRLEADVVSLDILSPLRLLKNNKPLFKAAFTDLFRSLLRRVSSLLSCHAGVEIINNPDALHALAEQVVIVENRLQWRDWRLLAGAEKGQDLGGLVGCLKLSGDALSELLWVLQLGQLVNLGKGATYGAGQFRVRNSC